MSVLPACLGSSEFALVFPLLNRTRFADIDLFGLKSLCAVVRIAHADGE
jgi:hypothetical protein